MIGNVDWLGLHYRLFGIGLLVVGTLNAVESGPLLLTVINAALGTSFVLLAHRMLIARSALGLWQRRRVNDRPGYGVLVGPAARFLAGCIALLGIVLVVLTAVVIARDGLSPQAAGGLLYAGLMLPPALLALLFRIPVPPTLAYDATPDDLPEALSRTGRFGIRVHNDDGTPMEFVLEVLVRYAGLKRDAAQYAMLTVHELGTLDLLAVERPVAERVHGLIVDHAQRYELPFAAEVVERASPIDGDTSRTP